MRIPSMCAMLLLPTRRCLPPPRQSPRTRGTITDQAHYCPRVRQKSLRGALSSTRATGWP
eukprot:567253-Lingulodinium_polyedra.AAC.1